MTDCFFAISEDGVRFKLKSDGTWEADTTPAKMDRIRFRSSDWGDSVALTKVAEKSEPIHETSDWLLYDTQVGGFSAQLSFHFVYHVVYFYIVH